MVDDIKTISAVNNIVYRGSTAGRASDSSTNAKTQVCTMIS